ncbi:MAG: GNAT family protein [Segetibacter sp.]
MIIKFALMTRPKEPYFVFEDIPPYEEFSFEKLTSKNFEQLYQMFEGDASAFTDERFKDYAKAALYARHLEEYGGYLPKHGNQDWLYLLNGKYAGIFHLYDLSLETFAENNKRCWIGFATKPALRNKGTTKKALLYFLQYIFKNYPSIQYIHAMTMKENIPAKALLKSAGFREDEEERMSIVPVFYLLQREESARR